MEPLKIEQLEKVKRFANDLGFNDYIRKDGEYAYFEIGIPSATITVYYEVTLVKGENGVHGEVSIGWSSCDGGQEIIKKEPFRSWDAELDNFFKCEWCGRMWHMHIFAT